MTFRRRLFGAWLALSLAACSVLEELPTLPPGWTLTPSLTATPQATSTPTITPTPLPNARVSVGDRAFFNGDYENALIHYQTAYQDSPDPMIRAGGKWGEARVWFVEGRYEDSLNSLQTLINEFPGTEYFHQAYFLQGLAHYRLGSYRSAADSWQTYLTLRPGFLDAYTQELRGDALFNAADYAQALSAYKAAIQAPHLGDAISVDLKVASTYGELGDNASALALYDGIITRASNDYIKAQAMYEAGLVHRTLGQVDEAQNRFLFAVENYPLSYYSYLSLIELLDAGVEVNELDRGLVDYFAGQYDVAIAAFTRYLDSTPDHDGTAYYYRALSFRDLGNFDAALQDYSTFLSNFSGHPRWGDAWGEKAFIEWSQKRDYPTAAQTLLEFVQSMPNSTLAVDYLMSAARIYERGNLYDQALQTWSRVGNEYPASEQASTAVSLMGVIYFRQGDYPAALESFNRSLSLSVRPEDLARAYLWIGKSRERLGNAEEARAAWLEAQSRDPGGYYSERARDLLSGRTPFEPPSSTNLSPDISRMRADADSWVRLTFNLPADTDLSGMAELASDARIIRGTELWRLDLYEDARAEFEDLRASIELDPVGNYRLTNYLLDLGLYRTAIFTARQTLTLAGLDEHTESMMAPPYFGYVRYGPYYSDIVLSNAALYGLDPLVLFSVIRQESLFEGFVKSTAGARGLMQIIPSTGAQLNSILGWPIAYTEDDLYRPHVSIAYGSRYLADNRNIQDGDLYAALAAYNGGPGNAAAWKELAGDDPDLYLESVRFQETRDYIRNIFEIYVIYKRLYAVGGI
ncbi:MAG: tetratricopeptide repeat protein [Chloroflexi bacterium]|nr:tetratricopeptide repeat protein [Chloroflexota bacterium]